MIEEIKQRMRMAGRLMNGSVMVNSADLDYLLEHNKALVEALEYAKGAIKQLGKMDDPDKIERFSEVALAALTTYKGENT